MTIQENYTSERSRIERHLLKGALLVVAFLLVLYLVFPGFLLGFMFKTGMIDPVHPDAKVKQRVQRFFVVPFVCGEAIEPLGEFYEWQMFIVSGYR